MYNLYNKTKEEKKEKLIESYIKLRTLLKEDTTITNELITIFDVLSNYVIHIANAPRFDLLKLVDNKLISNSYSTGMYPYSEKIINNNIKENKLLIYYDITDNITNNGYYIRCNFIEDPDFLSKIRNNKLKSIGI